MSRGYFMTRLGESVFAVWGVVTAIFFIVRLAGDPALLMLPIGATDQELNEFRHAMGLDSGCVYGGKLTAWCQEEDRIVQVASRRAYVARDTSGPW